MEESHRKLHYPNYEVSNGIKLFKESISLEPNLKPLKSLLGIVFETQRKWKGANWIHKRQKFDAFPPTKTYLTHTKHSMGLFYDIKGIGIEMIGNLNGKSDSFQPTKPYLTLTKHSNEFATQGYLESIAT